MMDKNFSKTRNYGIDMLRSVSMLMIITLHILGPGGLLYNTTFLSLNYEVLWFLEIGCFCSINCFALISGYVGYDSKYYYSNFILLWLRVIFYTFIITTIFYIFMPQAVSTETWINAIFPIMNNQYWYFSAYLVLFLLIPLLNLGLKMFSKTQMGFIIGVFFCLFSILNIIFQKDSFIIAKGYSGWWLAFLYLLGGYIKKYNLFKESKTSFFLLWYFGTTFLTWLIKFFIEFLSPTEFFYNDLITYNSFAVVLASVFLFNFFEKLKLPRNFTNIIHFFTPTIFSVYLIHVHPLIWHNIWHLRFTFLTNMPLFFMIISIFTVSITIFFCCCFIDLIRIKIFKHFRIKDKLLNIEIRLLRNLWN